MIGTRLKWSKRTSLKIKMISEGKLYINVRNQDLPRTCKIRNMEKRVVSQRKVRFLEAKKAKKKRMILNLMRSLVKIVT